jgi:hypothetical protein
MSAGIAKVDYLFVVITLQIKLADQTSKCLVGEFQSRLNLSKLRLRES